MGYTEKQSKCAYTMAGNDVNLAAEYLVTGADIDEDIKDPKIEEILKEIEEEKKAEEAKKAKKEKEKENKLKEEKENKLKEEKEKEKEEKKD